MNRLTIFTRYGGRQYPRVQSIGNIGAYLFPSSGNVPVSITAPMWVDEVQVALSGAEDIQLALSGGEEMQTALSGFEEVQF